MGQEALGAIEARSTAQSVGSVYSCGVAYSFPTRWRTEGTQSSWKAGVVAWNAWRIRAKTAPSQTSPVWSLRHLDLSGADFSLTSLQQSDLHRECDDHWPTLTGANFQDAGLQGTPIFASSTSTSVGSAVPTSAAAAWKVHSSQKRT